MSDEEFHSGAPLESIPTVQQGKQWLDAARSGTRPWRDFVAFSKLSKPNSLRDATRRLFVNVKRFRSNYLFVFVGLAVYCILTSPVLLFGLAFLLLAVWYIFRNDGKPITLAGREFGSKEQYTFVALISVPLFIVGGAGSAVFWIIGASIVVIMLHAIFMTAETMDPAEQFAVEMESVVVN
ncbi:prenylated Rab acceptor protein 1-like [Corticium candelabrum]|uniref:prenylated Rab acceptor protein 1-like n=1 Tax=Corticium candelabrum TaxID=121492 RepID=UPI002E26A2BF|nr:prenylated Rab acceptor protein 1-like [Corticium candelabrum]